MDTCASHKTSVSYTHLKLIEQLGKRSGDAILPVQIAYFTGLRLGAVSYTHLDVYKRQGMKF